MQTSRATSIPFSATTAPLPAPILLPWGNTAPLSRPSLHECRRFRCRADQSLFRVARRQQYFASGTDYIVTNNTGQSYTVFVSDQDTNYVTGQPIPFFAYSIAGPLIQDDATIGISFTVYSNLVSAPPPSANPWGCRGGCQRHQQRHPVLDGRPLLLHLLRPLRHQRPGALGLPGFRDFGSPPPTAPTPMSARPTPPSIIRSLVHEQDWINQPNK